MTAGDNYTRILGAMVQTFEDVNVGTRSDDGKMWSLNAKIPASGVNGDKLFEFVAECQQTGTIPSLARDTVMVLGKN